MRAINFLLFLLIATLSITQSNAAPDHSGYEKDTLMTVGFKRDGSDFRMGLRECLEVGLMQNFDIILEGNRQRITDNNATLGNAGYLPSADLSASYSGTLNDTKQKLANSGGTVKNNGIHNTTLNAGVNVGWTIFDGFSVRTTYDKLHELQRMGELNTRLVVEDFITSFTEEYFRYIRQYRRLMNLRYAVTLSRERMRIVEANYQVGTMSRLDLQQAHVDLNSDRSLLMQQYETMHNMRTSLNQLLGIEDIDFPIEVADSVIEFNPSLSFDIISTKMRSGNTYLSIVKKEGDISKLDLKLVESGRYPYIRANGGYGYTQYRYGNGTYDRQRNMGVNYGVTVGVNLFDGFNQRRKERNARIELQNSEIIYSQALQGLNKSLSDAWMGYQNNLRLTDLEKANLDIARENYEIAMERYRLGQLSGIELREAQNSLLAAEERLVQAQYDTKISEVTLFNLSGQSYLYLD